jgi:hypothetical protein
MDSFFKYFLARNGKDNRIQGGLPYRVEQSAAYWRHFNNLLTDLRTAPVGDFRDYAELANRRLGDVYGEVATIGGHYREQSKRIDDIASELQIDAMEKQTKASTKHQGEIKNIQVVGELITFLLIVPGLLVDMYSKYIGEEKWKHLEENSKNEVFGKVFTISLAGWGLVKGWQNREYFRKGWDRAKQTANEKAIPKLRDYSLSFGRCARDIVTRKMPNGIRHGLTESVKTIQIEWGWAKVIAHPSLERLSKGKRKIQMLVQKIRGLER